MIIALDGDHALSEAYVNSAMRMVRDGKLIQINTRGRYLDRWTRRDRGWGIDRRVFVCDFDEVVAAVPGSVPPRLRLDRDDPSFGHFSGEL